MTPWARRDGRTSRNGDATAAFALPTPLHFRQFFEHRQGFGDGPRAHRAAADVAEPPLAMTLPPVAGGGCEMYEADRLFCAAAFRS